MTSDKDPADQDPVDEDPANKDEVPDSPATWENVVVGEVKEAIGRVLHNDALEDEGKEQAEIAHEVREEYEEEHKSEG